MNASIARDKQDICLGPVDEFPPGSRRIVKLGSVTVGVFNVQGVFYAIRNFCPHEGASLCLGRLTGTNESTDQCGEYNWGREGMILRCPWHAWEFDLRTGESLFNAKLRVKTYAASIRDGQVWLGEKAKTESGKEPSGKSGVKEAV
jgi:nitrite reductase (NADH) small subunit